MMSPPSKHSHALTYTLGIYTLSATTAKAIFLPPDQQQEAQKTCGSNKVEKAKGNIFTYAIPLLLLFCGLSDLE